MTPVPPQACKATRPYRVLLEREQQKLSSRQAHLRSIPWPLALDERIAVRRDLRLFDQLLSFAAP